MARSISLEGAQAILAFPFREPGWQTKLLVGAVLGVAGFIIPLLPGIIWLGYLAEIMHRIIAGDGEPHLPEWQDWGGFLSKGFKVFAALAVYFIPSILFTLVGYLIMILPAIAAGISDSGHNDNMSQLVPIELFGMFGGMAVFGLGITLSMLVWVVLPPVWGHVVAKNSFAAAFAVRDWLRILRANLWGFFTALVMTAGIYVVMVLVMQAFYFTVVLCVAIPFVIMALGTYFALVAGVVFAEAYRQGVEKLATQDASAPAAARVPVS